VRVSFEAVSHVVYVGVEAQHVFVQVHSKCWLLYLCLVQDVQGPKVKRRPPCRVLHCPRRHLLWFSRLRIDSYFDELENQTKLTFIVEEFPQGMKDGVGVIFLVVKPLGVHDGLHRFVGLLREKVVSVHVSGILLYHSLMFSVVGLKFFIFLNGIIIDRWNALAGCIEL